MTIVKHYAKTAMRQKYNIKYLLKKRKKNVERNIQYSLQHIWKDFKIGNSKTSVIIITATFS